ncbi:MAG: S-methyl-5-thioribose-1-phosphate isomerase [Planctomycetes bacterium]|nr:S-methyl-5-thioribose-1-phosphate isomerase [Planctomycetota bacterium]
MNQSSEDASVSRGRNARGLPDTLKWAGGRDGCLRLVDQTLLPGRVEIRSCTTVEEVWEAIRGLRVRGAPAIGVAASYGLCLGTRGTRHEATEVFRQKLRAVGEYLCAARPTAVNLGWAIARVTRVAEAAGDISAERIWDGLLAEADAIAREDADTCRRIGEVGAILVPDGGGVLTHCNAGALATVAYGTALSVLYAAHEQGRRFRVFADETRPLLQGARLTAFELDAAGIDVTVICDSAAASLMASGQVQLVVVGADRIAANGDTANKIGTYSVAVAARQHEIPFYVAAPRSTFDLSLADGTGIPIEQRPEEEVRGGFGLDVVPPGVRCYNPAFDVTPSALITGIITEAGLISPVSTERIARLVNDAG